MRKALTTDRPVLVDLTAEFYAESGFTLNYSHATPAFTTLLSNSQPGHV